MVKILLYVSGEESGGQIKVRANRLNANYKNLLLTQTQLETILKEILTLKYDMVIIDSIQTIYSDTISSSSGTISQVKYITFEISKIAKTYNISTFIIGHITKDGSIAGPRVLEHMVDTVLYFEGEEGNNLRVLRSFKIDLEIQVKLVFLMSSDGLQSSSNISSKFFNSTKVSSGSVLSVSMQGSRAIIIEIQALVVKSNLPNPKEVVQDLN